jgi:excisionase family DNA binding protein
MVDKILLNIETLCSYLSIGKTKARELLHNPENGFTVKIGNRLYAHKDKLDEWLEKQII